MIDLKEIENPSTKYRGVPFWALNGKLKKEELKRQILNMKKMGFGGAFLHSRTGLETEYMSDEWMDLMEYCKNVLIENNMDVYLYDEDRYPSGTCGGEVSRIKEFKEKSLNYFEVTDFSKFKKPDDFVALYALKLGENKKIISYRKVNNLDNILADEKVYCFYIYYMPDDPFYNGSCMIDTMSKEATNKFIELTHEKYKKRFGKLFGNEIKGIFTDEPCRGPMFTGFTHINPNSENLIPYTYSLFDEFKARKGYDLLDHLPVIWFGLESDVFAKVTYDYVEVIEELFLENFALPYSEWCKNNNLKFVGHVLHEDNLAAQVNMSGSIMRFFEYMDYPGMDNLGSNQYCYNVPALVNSVVKQLDKEYLLDELYGVSGWPMKLEDYKRIGDWKSAGGVTFRVPHLCWYTMKGEAKRDCPASIFHQSSWYLEYKDVEDYFARLSYLLKEGKESTDIAIINPIESAWGLANQYAYNGFMNAVEPTYARLEKEYAELYKDLLLNGFSADYIDEGLFAKYGSSKKDKFICGKKSYKTIILNGNLNLRKTTLYALKSFIFEGGKVFIIGDMPRYLDGERYNFKEDLNGAIHINFNTKKLISLLNKNIVETSSKNLIVEKRYFGDDIFLFFINRQDKCEDIEIKVKTNKKPVIINLRSGVLENIHFNIENEYILINKKFEENEELALYFTNQNIEAKTNPKYEFEQINFENIFDYKLMEENFLVLNKCKLYFDDKFISEGYSIYADIELRKYLGLSPRGNQMLQPWFRNKYFSEANKKYGVARLHYEFNSEFVPSSLKIMFELQANEKILLNGEQLDLTNLKESPIDCCFSVKEINPNLIKNGLNSLDIIFDYWFDSNIEDHYLMGDFGIIYNDNIDLMIELPKKLTSGDLNKQGLTYFGGKLLLSKPIKNGKYLVTFDEMGPACLKINEKLVTFKPYKNIVDVTNGVLTFELSFTRQNTFGIITTNNVVEGIKTQVFDSFKLFKVLQN